MADTLYARLKTFPRVATVAVKAAALDNFRRTTMSFVLVFTGILTLAAAMASAWIVRRRIDRLDLVGVLKTRE